MADEVGMHPNWRVSVVQAAGKSWNGQLRVGKMSAGLDIQSDSTGPRPRDGAEFFDPVFVNLGCDSKTVKTYAGGLEEASWDSQAPIQSAEAVLLCGRGAHLQTPLVVSARTLVLKDFDYVQVVKLPVNLSSDNLVLEGENRIRTVSITDSQIGDIQIEDHAAPIVLDVRTVVEGNGSLHLVSEGLDCPIDPAN